MNTPKCKMCHANLTNENWRPSYRPKQYYICIDCDKKQKREQYRLHRKERLGKSRAYYASHRKEIAKKTRLQKFGLTEEEYDTLYQTQDGRCAICKRPFSDSNRVHVDHNHKTGKVRGLLCKKCNAVLGMADDNLSILEASLTYLKSVQ